MYNTLQKFYNKVRNKFTLAVNKPQIICNNVESDFIPFDENDYVLIAKGGNNSNEEDES